VNPGRLRRVALAALPPRLLASALALHGLGRQAWRAEGAPLKLFVEKVVTGLGTASRTRIPHTALCRLMLYTSAPLDA